MICEDCVSKINGFHTFATMALKNQEKMTRCVLSAPVSPEPTRTDNISLLHTYLTDKTPDSLQVTYESEEMEVRVDPMSILQCCLEESEPENDCDLQTIPCEEEKDSEDDACISYMCSTCKKSFSTSHSLQTHLQEHSQNKKLTTLEETTLHKCPICAKNITTKTALKIHLETHRPKGQYGCDICGRVFKTECNLFRHKEYHQGVQFPCDVCGRVYPTNSTLRAHSITHSDLRPHKCPLCDKTFKRNQDLKFHINQHTGARPYQCPYCPKAFASSGNCFSHRKRMHPLEVERDRERAAKIMR
ncbi:hypothetical protein ABEB36_011392 [Hypothenemus hampei]|uniref:C2H2-type domain-containing protein n=1 Tax=Hypothenemus hampei TaxID=57062 RepID=A0ABD1EF87_HYPHA